MNVKRTLSALLAAALLGSSATLTVAALEPHGTGITCRDWLVNDPNYTFSEAYKTSVWYTNFTSLKLSENERNNVLRIAVSQLGYHEGDSAADFDGMNTNGTKNFIEYARLLTPNYNNNSYEWCACFVNWCLNQAHISTVSSEISCWNWVGELKDMGYFRDSAAYKGTYKPKPADMIFFNWNGTNTTSGHIGYVLYTTDTHVFTVEGNTKAGNVAVRSYSLTDPCVIGYGTPPYDEGDEPTMDYSYKNGMPIGSYIVGTAGNYLTSNKGSGNVCIVPVGSCVQLTATEGAYAKVTYGDKEGYLPASVLYLMVDALSQDALTYDANGGANAPDKDYIYVGREGTVSRDVPTLEGDTFLGWSLKPYNYKVDFKPGDEISLAGDTTLYAVWQKRSLVLAEESRANGVIPAYDRPAATANSHAILPGTLTDLSLFQDLGDTQLACIEEAGQRVLSLSSTEKSSDPYVTIPYAELCRSLRLAPVRADDVKYIVLRVKDVSLHNLLMELSYDCGDGLTGSISCMLAVQSGWQYAVFDMTKASGWNGDIQSLRLDWERTANDAGNTLLISDICLVEDAATRDAVKSGLYVYPAQPLLDPLPESDTTATDVPTTPAESTPETSAVGGSEDTSPADSEPAPDKSGCSASVSGSAAAIIGLPLAGLALLRRKKED